MNPSEPVSGVFRQAQVPSRRLEPDLRGEGQAGEKTGTDRPLHPIGWHHHSDESGRGITTSVAVPAGRPRSQQKREQKIRRSRSLATDRGVRREQNNREFVDLSFPPVSFIHFNLRHPASTPSNHHIHHPTRPLHQPPPCHANQPQPTSSAWA